MEQYLRKLYYGVDSPTAFTSMTNLWRQIKLDKKDKEITKDKLKQWLEEQYTYSLHKPYKKPSLYRKTITSGVDDQWQADLVEMREFSEFNDDYNYLLCIVDCFSKFGWSQALKTKTGVEVEKAFDSIFNKGRTPRKLQFDEGKEFYNKQVETLLKEKTLNFSVHMHGRKRALLNDLIGRLNLECGNISQLMRLENG